ncbi:MAG: phosphoenolpyruvate synthase [Verrucomicrobia bacterium]|nr:MAG: phosphoenolpyruvate synthase [Verrucomicrobiota bacterium]
MAAKKFVVRFDEVSSRDGAKVGGKNAALGEMIRALKKQGVRVPDGFATTADAFRLFVRENKIDKKIRAEIERLKKGTKSLRAAGKALRALFLKGKFPEQVEEHIREAYRDLCERYNKRAVDVAVRSSATAEDLPKASFAGQQETYLNISGEDAVIDACRKCYASLFTDRAINYREQRNFDHRKIALSAGVQKMVRADKAGAGVMFSIDTESGFPNVVRISAAWGLGEAIVQGAVNPDEYMIFKPLLGRKDTQPILEKVVGDKKRKVVYASGSRRTRMVNTTQKERHLFVLSDAEILRLAKWACAIEAHYKRPMDIEWAKDGESGEIFILQARPETVQALKKASSITTYRLKEKGKRLLSGLSVGEAIAAAKACRIETKGIITDLGGRTCHAAIVSRELGIPAVVGTGEATRVLRDGQDVTLSCAEGDEGFVYDGLLDFAEEQVSLKKLPETRTPIMLNIASPGGAFRWWKLPCDGIGLARIEFVIANRIQIHPMALLHFDELDDNDARRKIKALTRAYKNKRDYFIDKLAQGIARIAAAQHPHPVIVRLSDFKTNEYAQLIGGQQFEGQEQNPMLGLRGASRYYHEKFRDAFRLECEAIKRVRDEIGLKNLIVMVPFCRTLDEADKVLCALAENGLVRGRGGLEIYMMCEVPSNAVLAEQFAERFDGFSIGSNDLTQLVLGVDRDSAELAELFDERNEAVKDVVRDVIRAAHKARCKVGICGEAPSDYPEFAEFLVESGIDSISINPDRFLETKKSVAQVESGKKRLIRKK